MASETVLNGRYRLVAQQGSGGMAVIYKAIDQSLGRTVAVKILRPSLTNDPAFLARFRNEARSVANLTHPNIVTVHDVGSDGPTHYIVMEFVEGTDLKRIIKAEGALPIERALNLAIQICAGIGFAHRAGLVHADVKPQNMLVTTDDIVKVTDFGIAQALSEGQPNEKQQVVWGSPHYFAPEQARGEKPTPASDVYSIGIVMFEMLTGRLPYTGANQQELALAHIRDRIPMVTEFNPNVPDSLAKIVYKTMSKEPASRYRMADQLGHILGSYRERGREDTISQQRATPPPMQPTLPNAANQPSTLPPPPPTWQQQTWQQGTAQPRTPLPQGVEPLPPQTQRYDLAPNAPGTFQAGRPQQPSPFAAQQHSGNTSQIYTPAYQQRPPARQEAPSPLDVVTIMLAILAFFSVGCLIPLYIAVFQARFG
ncbi:MAG TPA: protein kinase [Phototrophicaceae bacterium]|nr:protein kinase [Phototrophicaceae bacterium]